MAGHDKSENVTELVLQLTANKLYVVCLMQEVYFQLTKTKKKSQFHNLMNEELSQKEVQLK